MSTGSVHATDHRTSSSAVPSTPRPVGPLPAPPRPSPAEWARTLAQGAVPATLHLPRTDARACAAARAETFPVRHLSSTRGELLLLVEDGSALAERLHELHRAAPQGREVPAVLDVLDVPPGLTGIPRARLCASGWIDVPPVAEQRRLAASADRPTAALLDVGAGVQLLRLEPGDLRLTTAEEVHLVDELAYAAASPDALYADEHDLVPHVEAHHRDRLVTWVLQQLPLEQARQVREVAVAGLDRYGMDVLCTLSGSTVRLRAPFPVAVTGERDLQAALCRLFDCPCGDDPDS